MPDFSARFLTSIDQINAGQWNNLVGDHYPFLDHAFLSALEDSGSVSKESGWIPNHLVVFDAAESLIACAPTYLKDNSYGEYVFDWSWAHAYHQNRIPYYPKLLTAIPFTPCAGPRISVAKTQDQAAVYQFVLTTMIEFAEKNYLSSWHILFPEEADAPEIQLALNSQAMMRSGSQYHWYNEEYHSFEDYLGAMKARKRNSIRKERKKVCDQGIEFVHLNGSEMSAEQVDDFYIFYHATYMKRGMYGYLNREFFEQLVATLPEKLLFVFAQKDGANIASALFFIGTDTLFGRYWGCLDEYNQLHFETCYYQGIEYCIAQNLNHFDSGAQGEHKIQRGFRPIETRSWHWIRHPSFSNAIEDFLERERPEILAYISDASTYLPFKQQSAE